MKEEEEEKEEKEEKEEEEMVLIPEYEVVVVGWTVGGS